MAEMTALVVAVYRTYSTAVSPGFEDKSPAITSRFELFYDELAPHIEVSVTLVRGPDVTCVTNSWQEHKCMISFTKHTLPTSIQNNAAERTGYRSEIARAAKTSGRVYKDTIGSLKSTPEAL